MDDKTFELYFKKHILVPELSKEEELDCTTTICNSTDPVLVNKCIEKLIRATLRTVLNVARKYKGMGLPLEDLVQEGYFGILDALKTYDPDYDPQTRFTTHAYYHIKNKILEALNTKTSDFPLPLFKRRTFWRLMRDPDEVSEKERYELEQKRHKVVSLDALSKIPDFERKFGIEGPKTPEDEMIEKQNEEYLVARLEKLLTKEECKIVFYLAGFKYLDYGRLTLKELAKKIGVVPRHIRQIRRKIREKLVEGGLVEGKKQEKRIVWK